MKVGFFEAIDTTRVAMVVQIRDLLASYNLLKKLVAYVKDEGGNPSTLARAFILVVSCIPLTLSIPWYGSCFGHAFNKTCQYLQSY